MRMYLLFMKGSNFQPSDPESDALPIALMNNINNYMCYTI